MSDQPIRDAASLVLIDRSGDAPRVLMGRRRPDQVFLPNVFVFPGGRVDAGDGTVPSVDELDDAEAALLALPRAGHAAYEREAVRAFALAALRETFEETGFAIGWKAPQVGYAGEGLPPGWEAFFASGVRPRLSGIQFFLRAVTPPGRPRRYDTRFFLADAEAIAFKGGVVDDELSEIGWFGLDSLQNLEVPTMTRRVIGELAKVAAGGLEAASSRAVPFYEWRDGAMCRTELSLAAARS